MIIRKRKVKFNQLVKFPRYFKINGMRVNSVIQQPDGVMMFVDSERYKTPGTKIKVIRNEL